MMSNLLEIAMRCWDKMIAEIMDTLISLGMSVDDDEGCLGTKGCLEG